MHCLSYSQTAQSPLQSVCAPLLNFPHLSEWPAMNPVIQIRNLGIILDSSLFFILIQILVILLCKIISPNCFLLSILVATALFNSIEIVFSGSLCLPSNTRFIHSPCYCQIFFLKPKFLLHTPLLYFCVCSPTFFFLEHLSSYLLTEHLLTFQERFKDNLLHDDKLWHSLWIHLLSILNGPLFLHLTLNS